MQHSPKFYAVCENMAELPYIDLEKYGNEVLHHYQVQTGSHPCMRSDALMRALVSASIDLRGCAANASAVQS